MFFFFCSWVYISAPLLGRRLSLKYLNSGLHFSNTQTDTRTLYVFLPANLQNYESTGPCSLSSALEYIYQRASFFCSNISSRIWIFQIFKMTRPKLMSLCRRVFKSTVAKYWCSLSTASEHTYEVPGQAVFFLLKYLNSGLNFSNP